MSGMVYTPTTTQAPRALEKAPSLPIEVLNTCAYGEPSFQTVVLMGVGSALLASVTIFFLVRWARKSARKKFKDVCKGVFTEVDHDKSGLVDSDELYTAVLLVYLQVNKAIRVVGAVKPPKRKSVDEVLAKYEQERGATPGAGLTVDQFEDVMKVLSKDVAGRVSITCGLMLGCPMLGAILVDMMMSKFGHTKHFGPCGSLLFKLVEPQLPTLVSLIIMLVALPLGLDAVDAYLEGRKSALGAVAEKSASLVKSDDASALAEAPAAAAAVDAARDEVAKAAPAVEKAVSEAQVTPSKKMPEKKKSAFKLTPPSFFKKKKDE